jgi:hypothetical protein
MIIIRSFQKGSAVLVGLITASILGATLASYLVLVSHQYASTIRAQSWNMAIPVAEAGVDEALAHLNFNTNRNSSGWAVTGPYCFSKTNTLNDGTSNYFVVGISNMTAPVIVARGFVPAPNCVGFISRTIRVTTEKSGLFQMAMLAKGTINMNGNNVKTDSYDSTDPNYSNNGGYPSHHPEKTKGHGDIATNAGLINSLNLGNANIFGKASTGPGGGLDLGNNGLVGSPQFQTNAAYRAAHQDPAQPNVEAGYFTDDMNVDIPDVQRPWPAGIVARDPLRHVTIDGVLYDYMLDNGNYELSRFSGKLLVQGNAVLLVTDSFSMAGQDVLRIGEHGSLKLYVAAPSATIAGQGMVNDRGSPTNLCYYGLPTNTSLDYTGNGQLTGIVYAPNADFSLKGGGNQYEDFCGASVTQTVKMYGHFKFHYDESLGRMNASGIHRIISWTEVANPTSDAL